MQLSNKEKSSNQTRIDLTEEQSAQVSAAAGRKIRALNLRELQPEEIKTLAPGLVSASVIICCW